jgi:hypothetical protein
LIESNPIKFYLNIPESQKGIYTLPTSESTEGATLDSAVYLTIDRFGGVQFLFETVLPTTTTTTTTTAAGGSFFMLPDEDVTLNGSFFGSGAGYWDRLDSGIDSGTPDDTNGVVGVDGDNWRFGFTNPSFGGTSTEIIVRVRVKGDGDGNTTLELFSDGSSSDGSQQWNAPGSFGNFEKSFTIAKTAAQLTNLEVYVRADDYNDDWISEIEVEIVV